MAIGIIIVIIVIAGSLLVGSLIARRRQLLQKQQALLQGDTPQENIAMGSVDSGQGAIARPDRAHVIESDILPAYEPAPEYTNPTKALQTVEVQVR